jgi:hypothetical protein
MAFTPNIQEGKIFQWSTDVAPAQVWLISHNLEKYPAVITIDSGGTQVFGVVKYETVNYLTITFGSTFGGKCYLS